MTDNPVPSQPAGSLAGLYRWEEIEGWQLLVQHFDLTDGFAFIVVLARDDQAIALLRDQLAQLLPEPGAILRIRFDSAGDQRRLGQAENIGGILEVDRMRGKPRPAIVRLLQVLGEQQCPHRPIQDQDAAGEKVVEEFKSGIRHGQQLTISVNTDPFHRATPELDTGSGQRIVWGSRRNCTREPGIPRSENLEFEARH